MSEMPTGYDVLHNPALNKSTAFTRDERDALGLRGLLPHKINDTETQEVRVLENIRRKGYDIERYIFLISLLERNQTLFFRTLINHIEELMPLIYTPTVGQACKEFAHIFRRPHGFYITPDDRGSITEILGNWPEDDVRIVVVTDGERILGLGDLGANGMGIPVGKLSLYVACAGIQPHQCLPVMLDVGTNNQELLDDPLYLGYPARRIKGAAYDDLVEEFVTAISERYPKALLQFEDFLTPNAYRLLDTYRDRILSFNDDIQGTAAVALAGVHAALRITGTSFSDIRIMFLGAGSAATGIGDLLVASLVEAGLDVKAARKRLWFNDLHGLVVAGRDNLMSHNLPYAHDHAQLDFVDAIKGIKPHVLIGATGAPGTFTCEVVQAMSAVNDRPVIFALSNPTSKAECTAEQAYEWSDGRAIFASGSPFDPVEYKGKLYRPGQGNNAYIFPGIGLGAIACRAQSISDEMFLAAAAALAAEVSEQDLAAGSLYPPLSTIRNVSLRIAVALAEKAWQQGLARAQKPDNPEAYISNLMYLPEYPELCLKE
ncbi:NAD-dependent malic enzyme [Chromatiales bacterium (ex Bugula neritina AB1)]|nr:NAD-dependent malic enzyme [Chromatiales bacterium (ex Bugula neritina AB1)]